MDAVNLLPSDYRASAGKRAPVGATLDGRRTLRTGGILAGVLAVLVAGLYVHERSVVSSKKSALAKSQARLVAVEAQVQAIKAAQAAASARLSVVQSVSQARMNWDRALGDFARFTPTDSSLATLALSAPTPTASVAVGTAPVAGSSTLTITGTAPGTVGVARVLDRYALMPWLSNVNLTSASRGEGGTASFSITATVSQER